LGKQCVSTPLNEALVISCDVVFLAMLGLMECESIGKKRGSIAGLVLFLERVVGVIQH